jgi:hypothetical protein
MGPPFRVKAVYEYTSPHDDDLHFANGQVITVTEDDEEDWYTGEYIDDAGEKQEGIFPRNFVEKFEPTAPPRPSRAPKQKKDAQTTETQQSVPSSAPAASIEAPRQEVLEMPVMVQEVSTPKPPRQAAPEDPTPTTVQQVEQSSGNPTIGSFKDRIAAFNKSSVAPPAPLKPAGLGSSTSAFIKKPFIAPPPSRDAFVPVPPQSKAPAKIYKREEDPEIAAMEREAQAMAENAGFGARSNSIDAEEEPKHTSLKERIALLQKQQMEQAARHAEAERNDKSKRSTKKAESHDLSSLKEDGEGLDLGASSEPAIRKSIDSGHVYEPRNSIPRRRSSRDPDARPDVVRELLSDGNEADMSGAGDETEGLEDTLTGQEDSDDKPKRQALRSPTRAPAAPLREPNVGDEGGNEDQENPEPESLDDHNDDEGNEELRRKEELRARMAKMSGGMGMHGMMGMGMPVPGSSIPPKKTTTTRLEPRKQSFDSESTAALPRAPPIPPPSASRDNDLEASEMHHELAGIASSSPLENSDTTSEVLVSDARPHPHVPGRSAPPPIPSECKFSSLVAIG